MSAICKLRNPAILDLRLKSASTGCAAASDKFVQSLQRAVLNDRYVKTSRRTAAPLKGSFEPTLTDAAQETNVCFGSKPKTALPSKCTDAATDFGFLINPTTGALVVVVDGYSATRIVVLAAE